MDPITNTSTLAFLAELRELLLKYNASIEVEVIDKERNRSCIVLHVNQGNPNEQSYRFRGKFEPTLSGHDIDNAD